MIVIYTGIDEVDKEIQTNIRDSIIAHYSDYLIENNTFEGQTVIISPNAIEGDIHEFLFILKQMNMRVILLLKNKNQEETRIALQLGIYDILYGNFYPSQIKEVIEHPKTFRDVSDLYKKTFNIKLQKKKRIRDDKTNSFFSRK
ncbi:MAG: hypothetical protein J6M60_00590 [Clostridia bacterium]|nr:hypothetical protein [Clostridia bacterium]